VMHDGYGYGNGGGHWGMWILMIVAMVVFWGALAWIIVTLVRQRNHPAGTPLAPPGPAPSTPAASSDGRRILDERLARGEIDEDDYVRRRALIERTG